MNRQALEDYETVDSRLHRFWETHRTDGAITTEIVQVICDPTTGNPRQYVVKATVSVGGRIVGTGLAEEVVGSSPVNRLCALENAETSAVGRALANCGFSPKGARPTVEEMSKATAANPAREAIHAAIAEVSNGATLDELRAGNAARMAAEAAEIASEAEALAQRELGATVVDASRPFAKPTIGGASDKQLRFAGALTRKLDLDPTAALEVAREVTGNAELTSARDMTPREASAFIDELQRRLDTPAPEPANPWADDAGGPVF